MGLADQLDLQRVVSVYLFANTPAYLYRHLRSIPSIKTLADHSSLDMLAVEYSRRTSKEERTAEDVSIAYALLVSVTFWEYRDALAAFDKFDLSKLDWGYEVRDVFRVKTPISTLVTLSSGPRISSPQPEPSVSSTSIITIPQ